MTLKKKAFIFQNLVYAGNRPLSRVHSSFLRQIFLPRRYTSPIAPFVLKFGEDLALVSIKKFWVGGCDNMHYFLDFQAFFADIQA